jgi:hypothetical protein
MDLTSSVQQEEQVFLPFGGRTESSENAVSLLVATPAMEEEFGNVL